LDRYIPVLFVIAITVLLFPLFIIVNKADESTIATSLAILSLPFLAYYSLHIGKKRTGVKKRCFIILGIVFIIYFLAPIFSPFICGLDDYMLLRRVAKNKLQFIYETQSKIFSENNKYAETLQALGFAYSNQNSYEYSLNDKNILKRFSLEVPKDGFVAIAKADKIEAIRLTSLTYYCQDVWIIGNKIPLTNIKKGFPCDLKSLMTRMDAYRLASIGFIVFVFIVEHVRHSRKKKA